MDETASVTIATEAVCEVQAGFGLDFVVITSEVSGGKERLKQGSYIQVIDIPTS